MFSQVLLRTRLQLPFVRRRKSLNIFTVQWTWIQEMWDLFAVHFPLVAVVFMPRLPNVCCFHLDYFWGDVCAATWLRDFCSCFSPLTETTTNYICIYLYTLLVYMFIFYASLIFDMQFYMCNIWGHVIFHQVQGNLRFLLPKCRGLSLPSVVDSPWHWWGIRMEPSMRCTTLKTIISIHIWVVVSDIFYFHSYLGRFPFWLIFFKWVETTNPIHFLLKWSRFSGYMLIFGGG